MKELAFDSGIEEFRIQGGGTLRFNPADPNLYGRFLEAAEKLQELEKELSRQSAGTPEDTITLLTEADRKVKELLSWVLGGDNDLHKAVGGVNLLSVAADGRYLVTNLLDALEEIITAGAERFAAARAQL